MEEGVIWGRRKEGGEGGGELEGRESEEEKGSRERTSIPALLVEASQDERTDAMKDPEGGRGVATILGKKGRGERWRREGGTWKSVV